MFIDVHAHAYLFDYPPQDGVTQFCTVEEVLKRYDELNIVNSCYQLKKVKINERYY